MISISDFRKKHDACGESLEWTIANCETMQDVWDKAKPELLIWIATRPGVLPEKEVRLFACWCVRQVWHLLADEQIRNAVEVAERFARGEATRKELAAAWAVAADVAWDTADRDTVWAVWAAVDSASMVAGDAAMWTAWAVMNNYTWEAWAAQADYLRKITPNFEE